MELKNKQVSTIETDGRQLFARLRDGVIQPTGSHRPCLRYVRLTITPDRTVVYASNEDQSVQSFCSHDAAAYSRLNVSEPVTVIFDFGKWYERYRLLKRGLVRLEFVQDTGASVPTACKLKFPNSENSLNHFVQLTESPDATRLLNANPEDDFGLKQPSTTIETSTHWIGAVMEAVDKLPEKTPFPIQVENGELKVEVEIPSEDGLEMWGTDQEGRVEGKDLHNHYPRRPFRLACRRLNGSFTMRTRPGGPLELVEQSENATRQYLIDHYNE